MSSFPVSPYRCKYHYCLQRHYNNNNKLIECRQFTIKGAAVYIQFIRYNNNSFAKVSSDRALLRTASGKLFQTRGAAAAAKE